MERQPEECGQLWADLTPKLGESAQGLVKRYVDYVRGPINERVKRCFEFNESQRVGLTGQGAGQ